MAQETNQRAVHDFLKRHYASQLPFTQEELRAATSWAPETARTYWSKHLRPFVRQTGRKQFRVDDQFQQVMSWPNFRRQVSQVHNFGTRYTYAPYGAVLMYDFFMPLKHEDRLREALDALFYKDQVVDRLRAVDQLKLRARFPNKRNLQHQAYLGEICDWISAKFGGYSVFHVSGRFRAGKLATAEEAAVRQRADGQRYLVDETTAVVRFVFHCGKPAAMLSDLSSGYFGWTGVKPDRTAAAEADRLRWFFGVLFVEAIVRSVQGEDAIWMVESGIRNSLHVWSKIEDDIQASVAPARTSNLPGRKEPEDEGPLDARHWLRANDYVRVADEIDEIIDEWRQQGKKTRKNWWDLLAGKKDGSARVVAGRVLPVLRAAQIRQGKKVTPNALCLNENEQPPLPL